MVKIYLIARFTCVVFLFNCGILLSDSAKYNSFNNHGVVGLINMPTARFYEEASYGVTLYDGSPDQKITLTSSPYNWLEASLFYTNIQNKPYPGFEFQDYKDKGFNFKFRIKEEGVLPALAIGINDMAGTGYYGSEYIVSSYGIGNIDLHLGIGWGALNGSKNNFNNPFGYIDKSFKNRPPSLDSQGGQFRPSRYFSGRTASPFFGLTYLLNEKTILKIENDTTLTSGKIDFEEPEKSYSYGLDFLLTDNFVLGISMERGNSISFRFTYKNHPDQKISHKYVSKKTNYEGNKYQELRRSLIRNDIGVNKIVKNNDKIGIEITQFKYPSSDIIEEILYSARKENDIEEELLVNYKIADLTVIENFDESFESESDSLYMRKSNRSFNTNTKINIRPFIAGREGFLKLGVLLENDIEYLIKDNLIFSSNVKYSLWDNFDDLIYPPLDTYPAQVRSDVKDYLRNFDEGIVIGRAQLDFYKTLSRNHHLMITAGILEEMFSGYGFEYLWFDTDKNYAFGFEIFDVRKRDYSLRFGLLDYENITGHANFYYRNYKKIPFDAKISYGEYLAGDIGSTIELSRTLKNGIRFGIFASNTDVSEQDFGEGSFDKGIFFNVPIFGDYINYSWRPLTKDPGAKLVRKNNLHDLLIKFRPIN